MSTVSAQRTKDDIRKILENPLDREWSIQGLGMLRTYLDDKKVQRLHVWSDEARGMWDGASELHTHPWDMISIIMAGRLEQHRFVAFLPTLKEPATHMQQKILCGEGGGLCGLPERALLRQMSPEFYKEGDVYRQGWWEIHRTRPADGTVTIIARDFTSDPDHAFVYWPVGEDWVSAEPRPATEDEIIRITQRSLERWF
jgi:hypothetical protein